MVLRKRPKSEKLLTEAELELMNLIWDFADCTVREVYERLPKERDLAYTSVATIMKILEQKKILASKKTDKAHSYAALVTRSEYESMTLRHMAKNVFRNDPGSMVLRLLDETNLSEDELKSIRKLLNERLRS